MTLLLPHPFGPTMAVTPESNASSDRSGKLLKPEIFRWFKRIARAPLPAPPVHEKAARTGRLYPLLSSGWERFDVFLFAPAREAPRTRRLHRPVEETSH